MEHAKGKFKKPVLQKQGLKGHPRNFCEAVMGKRKSLNETRAANNGQSDDSDSDEVR
jgi:hypothetical protein